MTLLPSEKLLLWPLMTGHSCLVRLCEAAIYDRVQWSHQIIREEIPDKLLAPRERYSEEKVREYIESRIKEMDTEIRRGSLNESRNS